MVKIWFYQNQPFCSLKWTVSRLMQYMMSALTLAALHGRSLVIVRMFDLAQALSLMPFLMQPSPIYHSLGPAIGPH